MTRHVNEWRALCSQQWVREKILGDGRTLSALNVEFSQKSQQKLVENMEKMRTNRNSRFMEKLALKAKEGKATEGRIIHLHVKLACFRLIIELGKKVTKYLYIFRTICLIQF